VTLTAVNAQLFHALASSGVMTQRARRVVAAPDVVENRPSSTRDVDRRVEEPSTKMLRTLTVSVAVLETL
jgi:hypothetical protein